MKMKVKMMETMKMMITKDEKKSMIKQT